jgi:hypothetical protein
MSIFSFFNPTFANLSRLLSIFLLFCEICHEICDKGKQILQFLPQ